MRTALLALILLTATVAGCIGDTDPLDGPPATGPSEQERLDAFLADHPETCSDEDSCRFWDQDYHQYVVYDLDTYEFNMVVLPPVGGSTPEIIEASRMAAEAWETGILEFAEPWFAEKFKINTYVVGVDIPSIDALETPPNIVVVSTAVVGILGIGLEPKQFGCMILGEQVVQDHGGHWHGPNQIFAQDCTGIGFTCFAINAGGVDTRQLYDLIAHEIGHCLGAGHVGDALDFRARYAPSTDIMSYSFDAEHVNCVSNMNVRTLEGVFAHLLDRPEEEWLPRGSYYNMNPLDYENVDCVNPPDGPLQ